MSDTLKVEGHTHLVRDVNSNAIINTNTSDYQLYMKRVKVREKEADKLRNAVKEINNIKSEIREIKDLIKKIVK
jgi:hypothetical protein|tara:strand:- start:319 stop:540 length:222 start_codon:yes stop_codon:yes gene_type:complete